MLDYGSVLERIRRWFAYFYLLGHTVIRIPNSIRIE